jgi:hypothetical protein
MADRAPAAMAWSACFKGTLRALVGAPSRTSKTTTSNPSPYAADAGVVGAAARSQDGSSVSVARTEKSRMVPNRITTLDREWSIPPPRSEPAAG